MAGFGIYLHSVDGWYKGQFDAPVSAEWTAIKVHKDTMDVEGRPAAWGKVDTIRISAWRGQDVDTEFYIAAMGLFGTAGRIGIVRCDSAASQAPNELRAIKKYTNVMTEFLDRAGLSYIVLSDLDVTSERLKGIKLIILPHNLKVPDKVVDEIAKFLQAGGKLIAFYTLPRRLKPIVGIRIGPSVSQKYQGYFSSIRPSHNALQGMPAITRQASWNIRDASAIGQGGRIAA